jgi:aminoglycoside 3-N-acetyltransferase
MQVLTFSELVRSLQDLGLEKGDIVHVQSDLRRIGPVDAEMTRDGVCEFYYAAFREVTGDLGTLTVCTSFEDYGRFGTPFVLEESPSRTDTFSEYIRTKPGAIRSPHPIVSVTGIGPATEKICGGPHFEGFGYESPWGRLHRSNAKILSLGIGANVEGGMTFLHYVEHLYGVPYQYTKIYDTPVYTKGQRVAGPFTMSVRYLDFNIENAPFRIKTKMLDEGCARQTKVGRADTWCATAANIVDRVISYLNEDRWIYLQEAPRFRPGEIPADGPVEAALQRRYDKGA